MTEEAHQHEKPASGIAHYGSHQGGGSGGTGGSSGSSEHSTTSSSSSTHSSAPTAVGSSSSASTQDPVLHRLKELEESNTQNAKALERMKKEIADRDDKIKLLSADKRKEMESVLATAIDNWLNSLSGVSEENRNNFRHGISKLAEHADMNNAAWEIVCNASALHNTNVKRIEELLTEAKDRERELGELKGFRSEASRISAVKRPRVDHGPPFPSASGSSMSNAQASSSSGASNGLLHRQEPEASDEHSSSSDHGSAWDMFQNMMSRDLRSSYY